MQLLYSGLSYANFETYVGDYYGSRNNTSLCGTWLLNLILIGSYLVSDSSKSSILYADNQSSLTLLIHSYAPLHMDCRVGIHNWLRNG